MKIIKAILITISLAFALWFFASWGNESWLTVTPTRQLPHGIFSRYLFNTCINKPLDKTVKSGIMVTSKERKR